MIVEPQTVTAAAEPDAIAPDQSEIRFLAVTSRGSSVHVTLRPGQVSQAVAHRGVEEIWYTLSGQGEFWRRTGDSEDTIATTAGVSFSIPAGTHFQFRNTGTGPLTFVLVTMPPWPGIDEAYPVEGIWRARSPT